MPAEIDASMHIPCSRHWSRPCINCVCYTSTAWGNIQGPGSGRVQEITGHTAWCWPGTRRDDDRDTCVNQGTANSGTRRIRGGLRKQDQRRQVQPQQAKDRRGLDGESSHPLSLLYSLHLRYQIQLLIYACLFTLLVNFYVTWFLYSLSYTIYSSVTGPLSKTWTWLHPSTLLALISSNYVTL